MIIFIVTFLCNTYKFMWQMNVIAYTSVYKIFLCNTYKFTWQINVIAYTSIYKIYAVQFISSLVLLLSLSLVRYTTKFTT